MNSHTNMRSLWLQKTKAAKTPMTLLSPYITGVQARDLVKNAQHGIRIYTLFNIDVFASKGSDLAIVVELTTFEKCEVYRLDNLHAKVLMDEDQFASVGSQNVTTRGAKSNLELTSWFTEQTAHNEIQNLIKPWLDQATLITPVMIEDLKIAIEAIEEDYEALKSKIDKQQKSLEEQEKLRAGVHETIRKAIKSTDTYYGSVVLPKVGQSKTLLIEPPGDLLNWRLKNRKPFRLENKHRHLCVLDSRDFGWVRANKGRLTFVNRKILTDTHLIDDFPEVSLILSTAPSDISKVLVPCNLIVTFIQNDVALCVTGQQTHLSDPTAKGDGVHLFKWTPLLAF